MVSDIVFLRTFLLKKNAGIHYDKYFFFQIDNHLMYCMIMLVLTAL